MNKSKPTSSFPPLSPQKAAGILRDANLGGVLRRAADGHTAAGLPAGPGIVAVDPSVIPLGSTVVIDGQKYLAADTGVKGRHVDVCVVTHQESVELGVRTTEVWVEKNG